MNYRPITDVWILARPKVRYYGAYPNGFLERARALLGITPYDPLLHVCGGAARDYPGKPRGFGPSDRTLDLDETLSPDFRQSACLPLPLRPGGFAWPAVLADPPYTSDDAAHYSSGRLAALFPPANTVLRHMLAVVRDGGRVGMLHYVFPQPPRDDVKLVACVGVIAGYNNRMRCFSVFERLQARKG